MLAGELSTGLGCYNKNLRALDTDRQIGGNGDFSHRRQQQLAAKNRISAHF